MEKNLAKHGVKSYVDPSIASIKTRDIFGAVESVLKKAKDTLSSLEMDILLKKQIITIVFLICIHITIFYATFYITPF